MAIQREWCPKHDHPVELVKFCPSCIGGVKSKKKAAASRRNGALGGRPKKKKS